MPAPTPVVTTYALFCLFLCCLRAVHNPKFKATHPLEDCPTPLWVSQSRWLMMDLTARRTDWGPALGGDGVVVHTTLPDVSYAFSNAEEKRAGRWLVWQGLVRFQI
jgi:hypothetical protein